MKTFKYMGVAAAIAALFATTVISAKRTAVDKVYMFGFAASFNDSTVYFTNVQTVDSAWMDTKTKFLLGRDNYSYQLRNYLADSLNEKNRTCIVMFNCKKEKLEKKYLKLKRLYTTKANNKFKVNYLNEDDFKFETIDMSEPVIEVEADTTANIDKKAEKAAKKAEKKAKKKAEKKAKKKAEKNAKKKAKKADKE